MCVYICVCMYVFMYLYIAELNAGVYVYMRIKSSLALATLFRLHAVLCVASAGSVFMVSTHNISGLGATS